ncbi:32927_t:CDS:2, partial [Gigaspora margarita]
VIDVDSDSNCRYRALALSLGRNESEWPKVRKELKKKLNEKEQFYQILFLANNDYNIIKNETSWEDGPSNVIFLPHHQPLNRNEAFAIAFVNNNYYVAITLKPSAPVPLIVNQWSQFATSEASRWKLLIQYRINKFLSI